MEKLEKVWILQEYQFGHSFLLYLNLILNLNTSKATNIKNNLLYDECAFNLQLQSISIYIQSTVVWNVNNSCWERETLSCGYEWPLVSWVCLSKEPHSHDNEGSINRTYWVTRREKKMEKKTWSWKGSCWQRGLERRLGRVGWIWSRYTGYMWEHFKEEAVKCFLTTC